MNTPDMDSFAANTELKTMQVFGNAMLPLYRHGDTLVVSSTADVAIGDRVAVTFGEGELIAGTLIYRTAERITIGGGGSQGKCRDIAVPRISFLGRIMWASQ